MKERVKLRGFAREIMMDRIWPRNGFWFLCIALALMGTPVRAFITALYPLKDVLATGQFIFMAKVEKIDPDKPALVLEVGEKLKGQPPFAKLPMNLTGDSEGQKSKHTPQLLKRLEADLPVVVFVSQRGKRYEAFVYSNGTWFQTIGHTDKDDPDKIRWAFTHCEPYLRRTYKGTTADLRQVVIDGLSGKKAPPEPDPKVAPGLGPELEKRSSKDQLPNAEFGMQNAEFCKGNRYWTIASFASEIPIPQTTFRISCLATWAVIPTFVIMGPLALLAALFPAVFGGLAFFMRRWMVLLSIACLQSTLYWLHHWFQGRIQDYWWGGPTALWITLAALSAIGVFWSYRRHRSAADGPEWEKMQLKRGDVVALRILSLAGLGFVFYCLGTGDLWFPAWKHETILVWTAIWAGTIYGLIILRRANRRAESAGTGIPGLSQADRWSNLPIEGLMFGVQALAFVYLGIAGPPRLEAVIQTMATEQSAIDPMPRFKVGQPLHFKPKDAGNFSSSPLVIEDRIYQAAFHNVGFTSYGTVYCLDRRNEKLIWSFDDDGDMKAVFSSPCLADGRLYIGEGFHQDSNCKFYCLDASTGKKLWDFPTASHTESSPCVAGGKVFFGAGDDGVYCLDAKTGKGLWHFQGLHVDTNLTVAGNRVFGGSGYNSNAIFCLDANNGQVVWKKPVDLPCFASPTPTGDHVIFGLGNGDFINSDENPAGAILCVQAKTGDLVWPFKVADAVHGKPAIDRLHVYFGSRDGFCYCISKESGEVIWKQSLGSPIVSSVVLARCAHCGSCSGLYVAASGGKIACLGVNTGQVNWTFDVSRDSQKQAQILSTPALVMEHDESGGRCLYFGTGLSNPPFGMAAVLYWIQDELIEH